MVILTVHDRQTDEVHIEITRKGLTVTLAPIILSAPNGWRCIVTEVLVRMGYIFFEQVIPHIVGLKNIHSTLFPGSM